MPRLCKGEIALGTSIKAEAAKRTVQCRVDVFNLMVKNRSPSASDWSYFSSVDALALWHNSSLGITPVSPKTLRKYMADIHDGGLANLLSVAKTIVDKKSNRIIDRQRSTRIADLEEKASLAVDSALEMTARYFDLLEKLQKLAKESESASLELNRHFRKYEQNPHLKLVK